MLSGYKTEERTNKTTNKNSQKQKSKQKRNKTHTHTKNKNKKILAPRGFIAFLSKRIDKVTIVFRPVGIHKVFTLKCGAALSVLNCCIDRSGVGIVNNDMIIYNNILLTRD